MIDLRRLAIPDVIHLVPRRIEDARGWFSETYNAERLARLGIVAEFVQDNQSLSAEAWTVRGLHFQAPPFAQTKLVRVLRGAILDVAVDLRRGSASYGRWVGETLSARGGGQILIPAGFAHGFCTLEPETEVLYKVDNRYAPDHEFGIRWDDPEIGIEWPVASGAAILSERDCRWPALADVPGFFA